MGVDAKMLWWLEKQVREGFIDGVPPHLLPSTRSLTYADHSDQFHFFALHSEYINWTPQTVPGVLPKRHIIVHSHPFDHQYGWNLDGFAHLYNINKIMTVYSEANFIPIIILLTAILEAAPYTHPSRPDVHHFQGALHDFFEITTTFPAERCPPLNAISLPAAFRNLLVPSKWECIALHELAQSHIPASYATLFNVPQTRELTEWLLIGGKDAISSMHVNAEGFAT